MKKLVILNFDEYGEMIGVRGFNISNLEDYNIEKCEWFKNVEENDGEIGEGGEINYSWGNFDILLESWEYKKDRILVSVNGESIIESIDEIDKIDSDYELWDKRILGVYYKVIEEDENISIEENMRMGLYIIDFKEIKEIDFNMREVWS